MPLGEMPRPAPVSGEVERGSRDGADGVGWGVARGWWDS